MSRRTSYGAHLGEIAAALVDGELDHGAREAAFAHLAHCDRCRAEVDEQRRTKALLSELGRPPVPEGLDSRLRALGSASPPGTRSPQLWASDRPSTPPPAAGRRPPSVRGLRRPAGLRPRSTARRSRGRVALTGVAATLVIGLGTAFIAGGSPGDGRPVSPAVDRYAVEHAATTSGVSFPEAAVGAAVSASFAGSSAP